MQVEGCLESSRLGMVWRTTALIWFAQEVRWCNETSSNGANEADEGLPGALAPRMT